MGAGSEAYLVYLSAAYVYSPSLRTRKVRSLLVVFALSIDPIFRAFALTVKLMLIMES